MTDVILHETDAGGSSLIRYAIEQRVDVEMLERLVALQEQVSDRNARMAFVQAMAGFQADVPPILKTATIPDNNGNARSRFAPLAVIAETIREPLAKHGLSYSWDSEDDGVYVEVTCTVRHVEGHSQTASFKCKASDASAPKMSGVQISGSARSYGMRYSLVQVLGLTTADEDNDGAGGSNEITEEQAADLNALMDEVQIDRKRFLGWLGVQSIAEIPPKKYPLAVAELQKRRRA